MTNEIHRVTIIPNFNKVSSVVDPNDDALVGNLDLSDLNLEGVHAVHYYPETGTVHVEYIRPANEQMTVDEFHEYFGGPSACNNQRKHLHEALARAKEDRAAEAERLAKEAEANDAP